MNPVEFQGAKRKRSPENDAPSMHSNPPPASSNVTQINYLVKARSDRMKLIEGDTETFNDVLSLIDDYEGLLQRHESLAANLGAKLVGPLLLKSLEKLFEGPIKILQGQYGTSITWIDVIDFARTNPNTFILTDSAAGRVCQFWIKQCRVQISEDDYRLILSGAPERMIPTQPIAEDEIAELGTMDILEQRLAVLIRKADLVAGRARQLNYQLKGRKTAIQGRRAALPPSEPLVAAMQASDARQPPFQPVNNRLSMNGESQGVHQDLLRDLLRQFLSDDRKGTPSRAKPGRPVSDAQNIAGPAGTPVRHDANRRMSHPPPSVDDLGGGHYRPLMAAKNEKLSRGEQIWPPCDRCRRLRMDCTKYLTACTGCTKKHAKCTWNDIAEEEIAYVVGNPPSAAENNGGQVGAEMNSNLDPGLRPSNGEGMNMSGNGEGGMFADHNEGRRTDMLDEHSVLSHMASTTAVAGNQ